MIVMMSWLEVREIRNYSTPRLYAGQKKREQHQQQEELLVMEGAAVVFVVVVVDVTSTAAASGGGALLMTTICALDNEAVPLNGRRNMLHARTGISRHATIYFYTIPVRRPPASLPHHSHRQSQRWCWWAQTDAEPS